MRSPHLLGGYFGSVLKSPIIANGRSFTAAAVSMIQSQQTRFIFGWL